MEAEKILNQKIMGITQLIKEKHPELIPFLGEMSDTIPDDKNPHMNHKTLQEYYDSLNALMKKYEIDHPH